MRKIKFRAWAYSLTIANNRFSDNRGFLFNVDLDEELIDFNNKSLFTIKPCGLYDCEHEKMRYDFLMQYTGFKDKNGKEIYEGDIVMMNNFSRVAHSDHEITAQKEFGIVIFKDGYEWFKSNGWNLSLPENKTFKDLCGLEISGNVYENPELLK